MELKNIGPTALKLLKKYKYCLIILVAGLVLMLLPSGKTTAQETVIDQRSSTAFEDPTKDLKAILSKVSGAGKVEILLTIAAGEKTIYQTNEDRTENEQSQSIQVETVIITDANRAEHGLVSQLVAPQYRGAVVVCDGADDPAVKLAIMEAVKNVTGLGFDRISVLKMK